MKRILCLVILTMLQLGTLRAQAQQQEQTNAQLRVCYAQLQVLASQWRGQTQAVNQIEGALGNYNLAIAAYVRSRMTDADRALYLQYRQANPGSVAQAQTSQALNARFPQWLQGLNLGSRAQLRCSASQSALEARISCVLTADLGEFQSTKIFVDLVLAPSGLHLSYDVPIIDLSAYRFFDWSRHYRLDTAQVAAPAAQRIVMDVGFRGGTTCRWSYDEGAATSRRRDCHRWFSDYVRGNVLDARCRTWLRNSRGPHSGHVVYPEFLDVSAL